MNFTTFNEMLDRTAMRFPDKTFLCWIDKDRSISYAEGVGLAGKVVNRNYVITFKNSYIQISLIGD
jgi:hypothetical protein